MPDTGTVLSLLLILLPVILLVAMLLYEYLPWVRRARLEAQERAEQVVRSVLTVGEYEQLKIKGYLEIPSPGYPNRVYRIPPGAGMVAVLEGGRCVERLCAQSTSSIPEREVVVIHKLMIEANEQEYLKLANHFPCLG